MISYRVVIRNGSNGARDDSGRSLTKLELLKVSVAALLGLAIAIAFLLAASVIGLLLAIPLIVVGLAWVVALILRGKVQLVRRQTESTSSRHTHVDTQRDRDQG